MVEYSSLLVLGFAAAIAVFPSLRDSGFFTPKMPVAVTHDSAGHQHKHFKKLCLRFPNAAGCNGGQPPFLPSDEKVPDAHYQAVIPNCQYTPSQDMSRNGASPFVFRFDDITVRGRLLPLECYGPSVKNLVMMLGEDNLLFNDFVAAVNMTTSSPRKVVYYQGAAYQYNVYGYPPFRDWIDAINFIQYDIVNWIPLENMQLEHLNASKSMYIRLTQYYFIFKQPPMQKWQTTLYPHPEGQMPPLSQWMRDLTNEWGSFLNDDASLPPIAMQYMWDSDADSVAKGYPPAKQFKLNDYKASPGGYHSYNQWFGRGVKSGKRPISAPTDDRVLVRPCDSTWVGQWDITEDGCVGLTDEDINGPDQLLQVQRDSKHKKHAKVHSGHHIFGNHFHKKLRAKNKHVEQCMNNPKIKARGAIKSTYYYSVQTLLRDAIKVNSSWATAFNGGIFMHMFLNVNDYHRLHVPVRGRVLYNGFTSENVYLDVCVLPESTDQYVPPPWGLPPGTNPPNICPLNQMSGLSRQDSMHVFGVSAEEFSQVDPPDFTGYQFYQSRGVVIIDSPIGLVATVPMGMAQVSMVNQTADVGDCVRKGDEFSYFGIGGSDMVILVQPSSQFKTDSSRLGHLLQGEWFATATVDPAAQARLGDCGLG